MFKIPDPALRAFRQCCYTDFGKTGALEERQVARFRSLLTNALAAMHRADQRSIMVPAGAEAELNLPA